MRNIFCHEQYFDWKNLREFSSYAFRYFGSRETIRKVFSIYRQCCKGSLETGIHFVSTNNTQLHVDSDQFVIEPPTIQLTDPQNFALINLRGRLSIFCGMKEIDKFIHKYKNSFLEGRRDIIITGGFE